MQLLICILVLWRGSRTCPIGFFRWSWSSSPFLWDCAKSPQVRTHSEGRNSKFKIRTYNIVCFAVRAIEEVLVQSSIPSKLLILNSAVKMISLGESSSSELDLGNESFDVSR
jgi:hypothetical protein